MKVDTEIIAGAYVKDMYSKDKEPSLSGLAVAGTLLARDYKGLSNYGTNAVLVQVPKGSL